MNKKPATVPKAAIWNHEEEEWELGERNQEGDCIGEWKWWLAPSGHLCCHTFFDDEGKVISATRFHPNGEVSLELTHNEEGEEVSNYYRSTADTDEYFPDTSFNNAWRAEKKVGVSPTSYNFYDKANNLLSIQSDPNLNDLKQGKLGETAEQAIERFELVFSILKKKSKIDDDCIEEIEHHSRPYCLEKVSEEILEQHEQSLGVTFPPSYKNFVLKHGLFIFGKSNDYNRRMFLDYALMSEKLWTNWDFDAEKELSKEAKQRLDKIITFSYGDEGLQLEWYHCFDFNTLNPETGEVKIEDFNQDEMDALAFNETKPYMGNGFDDYMRHIVDEEIEQILDEL